MTHDLIERALRLFVGLHVASETKTTFIEILDSTLEATDLFEEERGFLETVLGAMRLHYLASNHNITDADVIESLATTDRGEFLGTLSLIRGGCLPAHCITLELNETLVQWLDYPTSCPLRIDQEAPSHFIQTHVAQTILGMYRKEVAWFEDDVIRKACEIADEQVRIRPPLVEA